MSDHDQPDEAPVMEEKDYTLIFCRRTRLEGETEVREVLLGMKKRGFGVGKWNGFGGKVEAGESFEQGAARELMEESSLRATDLAKRGYLVFRMEEACKYMKVHVYETWRAEGEPVESDEMRPQWYAETDLPFSRMWPDDEHWLPLFLSSNKMIVGRFDYSDSDTIVDFSVKQM